MADDVEIKVLPETRVAYMRFMGVYGSPGIADLWTVGVLARGTGIDLAATPAARRRPG